MDGEWDALWVNARLATMAPGARTPYGAIEPGAIAVAEGRIAWVGEMDALPESASRGVPRHEAGGAWITPGLIDCHTHLVYAGSRAAEFEQRLEGTSYEDIARRGGGILSTGEGDPGGERGSSGRARAASDRITPRGGGHHHRDKVGLRPRCRHRAAPASGRAPGRLRCAGGCRHHLPRRAPGSSGIRGPDGRVRRLPVRRIPAGGGGSGLGGRGGRLLRTHRLLAGADRTDLRGGDGARAARQAACGTALRSGRRRARPPVSGP